MHTALTDKIDKVQWWRRRLSDLVKGWATQEQLQSTRNALQQAEVELDGLIWAMRRDEETVAQARARLAPSVYPG